MIKFVNVNDNINNEFQIRNFRIIPFKERNNIIEICHKITGHKNYNILHEKIISESYYWNNITDSCKEFVKTCSIYFAKNKTNNLSPLLIKYYVLNLKKYFY